MDREYKRLRICLLHGVILRENRKILKNGVVTNIVNHILPTNNWVLEKGDGQKSLKHRLEQDPL